MARAISTICRLAALRIATGVDGSTWKLSDWRSCWAWMLRVRKRVSSFSLPSSMFCAAVIDGTRLFADGVSCAFNLNVDGASEREYYSFVHFGVFLRK